MNRFSFFLLLIFGAAIAWGDAVQASTPFRITIRRRSDSVEVKVEKELVVFSVRSPTGIGSATIERSDAAWPQRVELHLHVKGLENFRVSNGEVTLHAAVSSQDGSVRVWKDGKEEEPLDAKSPWWMRIRKIGADGKETKALPLNEGQFQISLPNAFFEKKPKSITVNWIDLYRN